MLMCQLLIRFHVFFFFFTKIPIDFLCKRGLNPRSLIQPLETLLVELTGTHGFIFFQVHVVDHVKVYFF